MQKNFLCLISGAIFGFGISLSGMTNPNTVIQFLDVSGDFNPALIAVLLSAVITSSIAFRIILKRPKPICDTQFHLPTKTALDKPLIFGAAIFGIGWGMAGYCPGAVIAALVSLNFEVFIFCAAMLVGMGIAKRVS